MNGHETITTGTEVVEARTVTEPIRYLQNLRLASIFDAPDFAPQGFSVPPPTLDRELAVEAHRTMMPHLSDRLAGQGGPG